MAQTPDEKTYVEIPFIEQLKATGWRRGGAKPVIYIENRAPAPISHVLAETSRE